MDIDRFITTIGAYVGSDGFIFYGLVFLAVGLAVLGLSQFVAAPDASARRMAGRRAADGAVAGGSADGLLGSADGQFEALVKRFARFSPGQADTAGHRLKLLRAGYFAPDAVKVYFGLRVLLALGLPAAFVLVSPVIAPDLAGARFLLVALALAGVGLFLPTFWVSRKVNRRARDLREGFPDALDMLVVCVEAGLGLDAAFSRVGREMWKPHPAVAQQFALIGAELRAGNTRADALRNMAERAGIDEIGSFVTLLIQSEQLGSSIAQTLRTYAYEMRQARLLRAEEKANKLPVTLMVPLVLFIFPCLITAIMLPAIIAVYRQLLPALGGS